ncbi:HDIG domain-containing metalloprotein [Aminipila terrae]|uniref:HDIG domain-containing protein n=1 Tax=Aminipila terrae TaxID=2697030 RepID=A0A6P1MB09_9FIRM|nr:HDIG domain-containing metalloprotein [Aminipila terrae]QHI71222.1 HDIG domain-containing protein [Aminipila terrae]
MTVEKELFAAIDKHILQDTHPSAYLNEVSDLPEFKNYPFNMLLDLKTTEQEPAHHPEGNAWNHTMLVLEEAALRKTQSTNPKVFMWSALLHDIGKPAATMLRHGRLTAYDHDKIGEKLSKKFLLAVDAPETFTEQVSSLVRYHMHILYVVKDMPFGDIHGLRNHTDLKDIALLGLCDRLGRTGSYLKKEEENIDLFFKKLMNKERK